MATVNAITPVSNVTSIQKLIEKWGPIKDLEELKRLIADLLIKFDTDPKRYTKKDYFDLLRYVYRASAWAAGGGSDLQEEVEKLKRLCNETVQRVDTLEVHVENIELFINNLNPLTEEEIDDATPENNNN